MEIVCAVIFTFLSASIINSVYKRYKDIQYFNHSLIRFRASRKYFDEENKEIREQNRNDPDLETGNDFSYDEHGNVIYGENYIGAPRLPNTSRGLNYTNFKKMYFSFNKSIRTKTIHKLKENIDVNHYLFSLVDILSYYENDDISNSKFPNTFEYHVQSYLTNIVGKDQQLSYFNEIIYLFYIERAQQRLRYVLCDFGNKFFE